jgi:hypothetical protein
MTKSKKLTLAEMLPSLDDDDLTQVVGGCGDHHCRCDTRQDHCRSSCGSLYVCVSLPWCV